MKSPFITIKCPKCGHEYLPSEIFIPNTFFGFPVHIERDEAGKIIDFIGNSMDIEDTFICDKCNSNFKIKTDIVFNTSLIDDVDFDKDYVTVLKSKVHKED